MSDPDHTAASFTKYLHGLHQPRQSAMDQITLSGKQKKCGERWNCVRFLAVRSRLFGDLRPSDELMIAKRFVAG
ncbi:hypothetical protein [Insulibacter thermoxylanivorax]|uniref:hypothetical protein n=1 Tax=Insulibacter thermoxylanivorax TaxID=2749268 RepID=UPI0019110482|nr:hypothetical protein [Insulibacter thermoxylanivorax]